MNTRSRTRAAAAAAASTNARTGRRTRARDGVTDTHTMSTRSRTYLTSTMEEIRAERIAIDAMYRFNRTRQLMKIERKLVRSCEHVVLLNDKIRGLTKRYQRARAEGFKTFRYNIRIRLAAVEGVRNMYYEYARDRAEEVAELRKELFDQNVHIVAGNDDDDDDDFNSDDYASDFEDSDDEDESMMEDDDEQTN